MIFDCHVHLPSPGLGVTLEWQPFTPDVPAAIRYLERCGIDRIVANTARGLLAKTSQEMIAGNDEIAQLAKCYPGFIEPACQLNTNFPGEAVAELRRCHDELGMVWIGELCGYFDEYSYNTPAFSEVMRLAGSLGMILQIHNDDDADMDRLCAEFPQTTIVLSHLGDDPDQVRRRIALSGRYPNLYLDICGNGFERMGVLELAVETAGAERVLFGSDFTINDPAGVLARIEKSNFDQAARAKILGKNLVDLLDRHRSFAACVGKGQPIDIPLTAEHTTHTQRDVRPPAENIGAS